jgi:hypothetical protein
MSQRFRPFLSLRNRSSFMAFVMDAVGSMHRESMFSHKFLFAVATPA